MRPAHIPYVQEVERACFAQTWPSDAFERELANGATGYIVAELGKQVVAYAGAWTVFEDMEVTSVGVLPAYRGQLLGQRVFWHLMALGRARGCTFCVLEVRPDNVPALAIYTSFGFVTVGRRKRYYEGRDDALMMRVDGLQTPEYAALLRTQAEALGLDAATVQAAMAPPAATEVDTDDDSAGDSDSNTAGGSDGDSNSDSGEADTASDSAGDSDSNTVSDTSRKTASNLATTNREAAQSLGDENNG